MAAIIPDQVRHRVNLPSSDTSDHIMTAFIVHATAEIEPATGRIIDYQNCEETAASCMRAHESRFEDEKTNIYNKIARIT